MGKVPAAEAPVVVHGMHPTRGYPVTLHITPVAGGLRRRVDFLVEQADGRIEDDEAWLCAIKTVELLSADEARELVEETEPPRR
ncbi:hypothetical protein AFE02nite_22870 [Actinotalea fermentans]|uniref:Uncharacterized protein n=2 Tax=Actinotalea fermentans TaxID=43671 RepID=A0A511YZC5_9CELL|nr:hypothetical protein AFE02nite_22870 [Actinotalea fermentans]